MRPRADEILMSLAGRLMTSVAPQVPTAYDSADVGIIAMLLGAIAVDSQRAVDARVRDNTEARELFASSSSQISDDALRARLDLMSESDECDLRITELDRVHDEHLALLIELHAHVEDEMERGEKWAVRLDADIWAFLERHAERHRLEP